MGHFFRGIKKKGAAVKFSTAKETMKTEQVINQDPEIHGGVPVFTGTRVPIQALIDHIAEFSVLTENLTDNSLSSLCNPCNLWFRQLKTNLNIYESY